MLKVDPPPLQSSIANRQSSIENRSWLSFVRSHPRGCIFHHPAWIELLADCYGFEPALVTVSDREGEIIAGIPTMKVRSAIGGYRMVSLPFSDHCAPLALDDRSLASLVDELERFRRSNGDVRIEVRWPLPEREGVHRGTEALLHETDLADDPDAIFARFHRTRVQQPIRIAEKEGVVVRRGDSWRDLLAFYELHVRTRRRLGAPPQPLRFFGLLHERLLRNELGFLLLAQQGSTIIAGSLFLHYGDTLTYKFNASDSSHWHLSPNHLILWHAMLWGRERGYRILDWGRTELDHTGLRDFKRGWGVREIRTHDSVLADAPPGRARRRVARLAAGIIRRSPLWVCRGIGELFYRQFA